MKLESKEDKAAWLFPDSKDLKMPLPGVVVSCANETGKGGTTFPVLTLDNVGQRYKVSCYRLDFTACVKEWGDETEAWIGKNVSLTLKGSRFVVSPSEQKIE